MPDVMDKVSDSLLTIFDKTNHLLSQYGGDAVDLALQFSRATAAAHLLDGLISLIFSLVAMRFSFWFWTGKWKDDNSLYQHMFDGVEKTEMSGGVIGFFVNLFLAVLCVGTMISAIVELFDVWSWISLFYPKLGLIHQVYTDMIPKRPS